MSKISSINFPKLSLAYSPCPNDTFIFYALVHEKINCEGLKFETILKDVEALNQNAAVNRYDITKLSVAGFGHLRDSYALLQSGAALGSGCGPLLVAKPDLDPKMLETLPVAVPGLWTTARLLFGLYLPNAVEPVPMRFDHIMPAVKRGDFAAGVIIHEGRFTYPNYGLTCVQDLGKWWEDKTGLPIPLGAIAIRRNISGKTAAKIEGLIRESIEYSFNNPDHAAGYIRHHAQELVPEVIASHIRLYVNHFSIDLGNAGKKAIETLLAMATKHGFITENKASLFAT